MYLRPIERDLEDYYDLLEQYELRHPGQTIFQSEWLFPSMSRPGKHIDERRYYMIMHPVGEILNINYLGTHTMRKTGAYRIYEQSHHNIALVMKLLNHSSEKMTLEYLDLDQEDKFAGCE